MPNLAIPAGHYLDSPDRDPVYVALKAREAMADRRAAHAEGRGDYRGAKSHRHEAIRLAGLAADRRAIVERTAAEVREAEAELWAGERDVHAA